MNIFKLYTLALSSLLALALSSCSTTSSRAVSFPAKVDHSPWDSLLKKYVNEQGLVDYAGWKKNAEDREKLEDYLASFSQITGKQAKGDDLGASTANAYNAFAISFIMENYPLKSIRDKSGAFTEKRNLIGGQRVSLDAIEKGTGIPELGWKAHGIFVCCAKSCPPLQRFAYTPEKLDEQIDIAFTAFAQRDDLNFISPLENKVTVSKLFDWYKGDFAAGGGAYKVLAKYAKDDDKPFLLSQTKSPRYLKYNWKLNEQN